jgi:hypothetical protein
MGRLDDSSDVGFDGTLGGQIDLYPTLEGRASDDPVHLNGSSVVNPLKRKLNFQEVENNILTILDTSTEVTEDVDVVNERLRVTNSVTELSSAALNSAGRITRFAQPRYPMFETRDNHLPFDDYGRGLDDLEFRDITSGNSRYQRTILDLFYF